MNKKKPATSVSREGAASVNREERDRNASGSVDRAERGRSGHRRIVRVGALVVCGGLLTACAAMPESGDVSPVEATQRADSQVRVFGVPPRDGARPEEIIDGFLEALTSDDPNFAIAREYLTDDAAETWEPEVSTTVLRDGPNTGAERARSERDGGFQYTLTGRMVAKVDDQHAYQPSDGAYSEPVHLTQNRGRDGKEWRIDAPPTGVVLGESDFQRIYRPVNKYYFAARSASGPGSPAGLVADPVYVRQRIDPVTETVKSLLAGPTHWLDPVVESRFPSRTRLKEGTKSLAPDDQNRLKVPLNSRADRVGQSLCTKMAAQLLFTLQDLTSSGVEEVELLRSTGSQLCVLDLDRAESVVPRVTAGQPDYQYFLDAEHRLVRMPGNADSEADADPVPGEFGVGEKPLRAAAVSRDEERAAGVSLDGRSLFVGSMTSGGSMEKTDIRSRAKAEKERLTSPSWDGRGDLWVADRDPKNPRLLWLGQGEGKPVEVKIADIGEGRVDAVRVAADGVRIALIIADEEGNTSLRIGRVERQNSTEAPVVDVVELRPAAPHMEEVTAMSWAGGSRLVVVGRESGGVQQLRYVQSDGSAPSGDPLPGLTGVKEITASEDDRLPLVARSDDGIVRLPGASWQTVLKDGTAPVYPG